MNEDEKIFNQYGQNHNKFSLLPEGENIEDYEVDENGDLILDEEGNPIRKKPTDDEFDEDEDEVLAFSNIQKNRKNKFNRTAKVHSSRLSEIGSELYDKFRELQDAVNDPTRQPMVVDNGSVLKLQTLFEPMIAFSFNVLSSIPTAGLGSHEANVEGFRLLDQIKQELAEIANANSSADKYAMIMNMRSLYLTLLSFNQMIHGEPNLVNEGNAYGQKDLWRLFQGFSNEDGSAPDEVTVRNRNATGDNAIEPDLTLIKPTFLLFPSQRLKRQLMKLAISDELIGDYDDDNDFGILGTFGIPTEYGGTGSAPSIQVPEEDRVPEGLMFPNVVTGGSATLRSGEESFTWSRNGTTSLRTLEPASYRKHNSEFLSELNDLINKAKTFHIREISNDIAFLLILTGWLNSAFKVLVETNFNGVIDEVDKGMKFNMERMVGANNDDILFKLLSEVNLDKSNISNDVAAFKSIYHMPIKFLNDRMAKSLGGKFHYSERAYKLLQSEYRSMTFKLPSDVEYFIANNKVGDHAIKITVAPKLYLPVDIMADQDIDITVDIPRPRNTAAGVIKNIFSFVVRSSKTHYVATRDVSENDYILNQSIFHALKNLTRDEYSGYLDFFYADANYIAGNDVTERSLDTLFGRPTDLSGYGTGYTRLYSGIAPFYNKSKILGLTKPYIQHLKTTANRFAYPIMDESFFFRGSRNNKTSGGNDYGVYLLSDYIRAVFNFHGDWSWIEAAIVAAMIQTRYMSDPKTWIANGSDPIEFPKLTYSLTSGPNLVPTSTVFRQARSFMDSQIMKFGFTRFTDSIVNDFYPVKSNRITKADILKAFRYTKYDRTNYYLIDNLFKDNFAARKHWLKVENGKIDNILYLIEEKTPVMISEKNFINEILDKDSLDGSLLLYDSIYATGDQINFTPTTIPATSLVGLEMTLGKRNKVLQDIITDDKVYTKLGLNKHTYIADDFYASQIIYTVTLPTNTKHILDTIPEAIRTHSFLDGDDNTNGALTDGSVNNLKYFEVALQAAHRTGMMAGNPQGFRLLLQMAFGINSQVQTKPLVRNADTYGTGSDEGEGIEYDGNSQYSEMIDVTPEETASFTSSHRYPQTLTTRAIGLVTGLPKHISAGSLVNDSNIWSLSRARKFYDKLGATVETNRTEAQTAHLTEQTKKLRFFELRQGLNSEYGVDDYNLAVIIPARTIVNVTLEMEDKE